ncbi:MAG: NAD(P)-dependent oxidoreductase [Geobacteraceae bacterium]|nr:NAD(P)-dependent oxidoreductase [Geobacteraceae bacterium]
MKSTFSGTRILVTGGSGFIGTNLMNFLLKSGCLVCNLDMAAPLVPSHRECWKRLDILDAEGVAAAFRSFLPTYVVHLAARTDIYERNSIDGYAANMAGTENVLRAVSEMPGILRVIVTSSMLVCRIGYVPESDCDYAPPNLYGQSKVMTETITRGFGQAIPWTIIRPTTIWGPWSLRYRDEFFRVLSKGQYLHPGNDRIIKTYGYVGNAVHQICQILQAPAEKVIGKTLYVGDPPLDLGEWVDGFSLLMRGRRARRVPLLLMRLLALSGDMLGNCGIRFPLTSFRLANMTSNNVIDLQKTIDVTGDGPYSLAKATEETIRWLNECNGDGIQ